MENKLRDNEIIKALECCISDDVDCCNNCKILFSDNNFDNCESELHKQALNLINRQKSVIERLNKRIAGQKHSLFEQQSYTAELQNELKTIKSEAVKEFAERVNPIIEELVDIMFDDDHSKCMIKNCHKHSSIPCESVVCIDENKTFWKLKIYNLLNEMVDAPSVSEADSFLKDGADGRVVKGKWLINPDGYYPYCSECKEEPKGRIMTKFCPECGADMSKL